MAFKVFLCALALLVQSISGNCADDAVVIIEDDSNCGDSNSGSTTTAINIGSISSNRGNTGSSSNCGSSSSYGSYSIINPRSKSSGTSSVTGSLNTSGGPFFITSTGPVVPSGIIINSNNNLAGDLTVAGQLPFLSAVAFEGSFPTNGLASVSYRCGDGNVSIQEVIGGSSGSSACPTSSGAYLCPGSVGFPSASLGSGSPGPSGSSGYSGTFGSSSNCKHY